MNLIVRNTLMLALPFVLFAGEPAHGFSPYENYLTRGGPIHVGLIAAAAPNADDDLASGLATLAKDAGQDLSRAGIIELHSFQKEFAGKTWYLVRFVYTGPNPLDAARIFERASPLVAKLNPYIDPHPRAKQAGSHWLQMEWINFIQGMPRAAGAPQNVAAMVTGVKPEMEQQYRTLHLTTWPGVIDRMIRSHNRHFSVYLVEVGDELYELAYYEYLGTDPDADQQAMVQDPCSQRWWKLTDPCQKPLPGTEGKGTWSGMDHLVPTVE